MMRRDRARYLPAVLAAALVLPLSACSGDTDRCAEAFAEAATAVSGVVSAEWECSDNFGGGWQRGDVVVSATTEDEAVEVMDGVLRSIAAAGDLEADWATPQQYANEDGSIVVGANALGFNGPPTVGEVREHYDITPG